MNLVESYEKIKPTIVAFSPKFYLSKEPPKFPLILGTGFIVAEGIVATNHHVMSIFNKLSKPDNFPEDQWAVDCILFYPIKDKGMAIVKIDVLGVFGIKKIKNPENYMGPEIPDISFIKIKMKNLPKANIIYDLHQIKEGRNIATSGFPMGTETLMAPGYIHQLSPTLQEGIISAILPFPCKYPHSLMINIMVQGGASGSPVFLPETGDVIGVLYAGLKEYRSTISKLPNELFSSVIQLEPSIHDHHIQVPTNISYVVPSHIVKDMLDKVLNDENNFLPENTPTIEEYIDSTEPEIIDPKTAMKYSKWKS